MKAKVMLARFPGNHHEDPDTVSWMLKLAMDAVRDPRVSEFKCFVKSDTPITMVRNECVQNALDLGIDYLVMIDNDMKPDCPRPGKPFAPFWKSSFDWIFRRGAPAVIASPYVGPNPHNNIYIFRWSNHNNYDPGAFRLRQFSREEAAERSGIEQVSALPTGLVLIDMRVFDRMPHPWFEYEWMQDGRPCHHCGQQKPGPRMAKASTEDVYWSRNLAFLWADVPGAGVFCNWDSWSIHIKRSYCLPPEIPTVNPMYDRAREADEYGRRWDETARVIGEENAIALLDDNPEVIDLRDGPQEHVPDESILGPGPDGRIVITGEDRMRYEIRRHYQDLGDKDRTVPKSKI